MSTQEQNASPNQETDSATVNQETGSSNQQQDNKQQKQGDKPTSRESALRALARELSAANKTEKTAESSEKDKQSKDASQQEQPQKREPLLKTKPKTINELADALGFEAKDLYDLEVPSSKEGEKPYTLGTMKDHMVEREDFTVKSLEFSETRRKAEADIVRANAELSEIFSMLPPQAISEKARELARNRVAKQRQVEAARTLNMIPEWRDEKVREADLGEIAEHLSSYGFDESYLMNIYDHRMFKIMRDFAKQTKNLQKALALVTESRTKTPAPSKNSRAERKGSENKSGMRTNSHDTKRDRFLAAFTNSQ